MSNDAENFALHHRNKDLKSK